MLDIAQIRFQDYYRTKILQKTYRLGKGIWDITEIGYENEGLEVTRENNNAGKCCKCIF